MRRLKGDNFSQTPGVWIQVCKLSKIATRWRCGLPSQNLRAQDNSHLTIDNGPLTSERQHFFFLFDKKRKKYWCCYPQTSRAFSFSCMHVFFLYCHVFHQQNKKVCYSCALSAILILYLHVFLPAIGMPSTWMQVYGMWSLFWEAS